MSRWYILDEAGTPQAADVLTAGRWLDVLLYETMIFGGPLDGQAWRYGTRAEAEKGHEEAVKLVRESGQ